MKAHFETPAARDAWANRRLHAAAGASGDAARKAPAGAFFGSPRNTPDHLLVTCRMQARRFTGEGEPHDRLGAPPFGAFTALKNAREALDARIPRHAAGLSEADLTAEASHNRRSAPGPAAQTRGAA